jgi:hypothetical protein
MEWTKLSILDALFIIYFFRNPTTELSGPSPDSEMSLNSTYLQNLLKRKTKEVICVTSCYFISS